MKKSMKKLTALLVVAMLLMTAAGCGSSEGAKPASNGGTTNTVQNVLDQKTSDNQESEASEQTDSAAAEDAEFKAIEEKIVAENDGFDVDLTKLSSTMVYSEVYNMMSVPDDYIGKSVRMSGQFALYQAGDENGKPIPGQYYYACIIADATACCQQGMEFILAGNKSYPEDYPEIGDDITVSGVFETYDENGYMYCHLIDSQLE